MLPKKPIMSPEVEIQVMNAVAQYTNRKMWKLWGLDKLRKQGAAILLSGPAGTGKTTIANYISLTLRRKGMHEVSFGDFGSHIPGENARQIRMIFDHGKENENMTLFIDDCEAVLWSRQRAEGGMMWMLEIIDEMLVQIGKYEGLVILATNMPEILDPALDRRLIAKIHVDVPDERGRLALWRTKVPEKFPIKLSTTQCEALAKYVLTGAEIENAIMEHASDCIRAGTNPNFKGLEKFVELKDRRNV